MTPTEKTTRKSTGGQDLKSKIRAAQKRFLEKRKSNLVKRPKKPVSMDCLLYKLNPPEIPKKVQEGLAEIPDVSAEPPKRPYRGREFEEPMTVEEVERDNKEAIEAKWSDRDREHFVSICKKFGDRYNKINKIEYLKEKFPKKPRGDIIKYYYLVIGELKGKIGEKLRKSA